MSQPQIGNFVIFFIPSAFFKLERSTKTPLKTSLSDGRGIYQVPYN